MDSIATELEQELHTVLVPVCATWGITLDQATLSRLQRYALELLRWNEQLNLTRIITPHDIVVRHFLDSFACARAWTTPPTLLIDIGTGAGFPGIPLKLLWPELRLTLSDSIRKKTTFVTHVVELLELPDVAVVTARAEDMGHHPAYRGQFDACIARAVAALPVLAEYCLPLCGLGGRFVAPKGAGGVEEAQAAEAALIKLGGTLGPILAVDLPGVEPRVLVVVDKIRATPAEFPRAAGVPAKRPL